MMATLVILPLVYWPRVLRAEASIKRQLGPLQPRYAAAVPALLPRLLPLPRQWSELAARGGRYSLEYALLRGRHRELDAMFVLVVTVGVLFALRSRATTDLPHWRIVVSLALAFTARITYYATKARR